MKIRQLLEANPGLKTHQKWIRDRSDDQIILPHVAASEIMQARGWERLGGGLAGQVVTPPNYPWAIKFYKDDPAYEAFVSYCLEHPDNPHLPKFRGKAVQIARDTKALRVEKLQKMTAVEHRPLEEWMAAKNFSRDHQEFATSFFDRTLKSSTPMDAQKKMEALQQRAMEFQNANSGLCSTIEDLHRKFPEFEIDLHGTNVMKRGPTKVLIDPLIKGRSWSVGPTKTSQTLAS